MTRWTTWAGLAIGAWLVGCGSDSGGTTSGTGPGATSSAATSTSTGPATGATSTGSGTSGSAGSATTSGDATGAGGASTAGSSGSNVTSGAGGSGAGAGGSTSGAGGTGGASTDGGPAGSGGSAPADAGSDSGASGLDPAIGGAVGSVSSTRIGSSINMLAGYPTRNACATPQAAGSGIVAARDWVKSQFQAIAGLTVSTEPFSFMVTIPMDGTCGPVTDHNVIAVKLGAHPDRVFVIGGHYDSRTVKGTDFTSPAPGANDSASQTAAVLEIARAMAPLTYDATLIFAAFAAEEQGLYGSAQLAKDYKQFVTPNAKVEAMLDLDIVGGDTMQNNAAALQQFRLFSPGTPREVMPTAPMGVTDDESPSRNVMRYVGYWGSRYVPSMTMVPMLREDRVGRGSDHESFLNLGYAGVHFIETVESPNAGMPGSHQHTADDLPSFVTPAYTARIAQVVVAVGASLARAPMPPGLASVTGTGPWTASWTAPVSGPAVDHYVIAARPSSENFYHSRVVVPANKTSQSVTATDLGLAAGSTFYASVAAVDGAGHESLFAYPEYRCTPTGCVVPADANDVTAMR